MKRDLRFAVVYSHPPERVWRALTDSRAIAAWLMPNDFEPRVGHMFQFRSKPQPGWFEPVPEGTRLRLEHTGFRASRP